MRLTMTGKKDSAVTVLPLTDAVLVLLVLALINVAPVFFAAVNLSWPTGQARHAVPSPSPDNSRRGRLQ